MRRFVWSFRPPRKKGQLSIILILVAFIVLSILIISYIENSVRMRSANDEQLMLNQLNNQFFRVNTIVEDCFNALAWQGLEQLGENGGYIAPPPAISNGQGVAYWALDQVNIQPSLEDQRIQLEKYVTNEMDTCVGWSDLIEGFSVRRGDTKTFVYFSGENVIMNLSYPFTIKKGNYDRSSEKYQLEYDLRFRRMVEMATQINARTFDTKFNRSNPLANVAPFDLNLSYYYQNSNVSVRIFNGSRPYSAEEVIFRVRDAKQYEEGRNDFTYRFSTRFLPSRLPRTVDLPNATADFKTSKPMNIFSTDKNALVPLPSDIYIYGPPLSSTPTFVNGSVMFSSPKAVRISQLYGKTAVRSHVPAKKEKKKITEYKDIVYYLDYPVYGYEPAGTKFSEPVAWIYSWEPEDPPGEKIGVLHYDGSQWTPVVCDASIPGGFVMTDIKGFSNYTAVKCKSQTPQTVTAETSQTKPPTTCIIIAVVIIIIIVIIIVAPVLLVGGTTLSTAGQIGTAGTTLTTASTTTATGLGAFGMTTGVAAPSLGVIGSATAYSMTGALSIGTAAVGAGAAAATAALNIDPLLGEPVPKLYPLPKKLGIAGVTGLVAENFDGQTTTGLTDTVAQSGSANPQQLPVQNPSATPIPFSRTQIQTQQFLSSPTSISPYDTMAANYTMAKNNTNATDEEGPEHKEEKKQESPEDQEGCITFKPVCDGTITVDKKSDKAKGKCTLKSGMQVKGGQEYQICAQISGCSCFCGCTCTLSCEVGYT